MEDIVASGRNTVTIFLVAVGGILLVGVVAFAPLPVWLPVVAATFVAGIALLVKVVVERLRSNSAEVPYIPPPPPPVESRAQRVAEIPLPSQADDYDFLFSATILWSPLTRDAAVNQAALAVDAILRRASEITRHRPPGRATLVGHELGAVLGTMEADGASRVLARAESVQLVHSAQDQERLDKLAAVRKDTVVWEHDRKYEQSRRQYLGEDVLKDTGSAVVWWLVKNDDRVERAVQDIDLLARLSTVANNKELPEPGGNGAWLGTTGEEHRGNGIPAADHMSAFLHTLDPQERELFTDQIVLLLRRYGQPDVADEIRRRFGLSDPPFVPADEQASNDEKGPEGSEPGQTVT